jgi:uncharacterized damage-inducible protein DinB
MFASNNSAMSQQFDIIKAPRTTILAAIESLSLEQLNTIPAGFNNNIMWNLGHMIAAQNGICYKRPGLPLPIDELFFETYKPGTKPERFYNTDDLAQIKELMFSTLDKLEADLQTDMFSNYATWTTRYGADITSSSYQQKKIPFALQL